MCDFKKPWFGSSEPDGVCIDGYLQDINHPRPNWDCRLHPCPRCNTRAYLLMARDEYDRTIYLETKRGKQTEDFDPENFWNQAKAIAREENQAEAGAVVAEIEAGSDR